MPARSDGPPPPAREPLALRTEGGTTLYLPETTPSRGPGRRARIFYNPAMAFDRDLNVAFARAARALGRRHLTGWEMLGATGVRGIRLARETGLFERLVITERVPEAFQSIRQSVTELHLKGVEARCADARQPPGDGPFDYVDLDPYGSPLPYLDSMFRSVRRPGILAVTATDMMVLAGVVRGSCEARYAARPLHGRLAPEGALRILLAKLAREASSRGARLAPLLCYVHDHHVRIYAEVLPEDGSRPEDPIASIDAATWTGPPLGPGAPHGPLWTGPIFAPEWIHHLEPPDAPARPNEIAGWIARLQEEAEVDEPFFYEPNEIARTLHLARPPPIPPLLEGLRRSGARAARAHPQASAIRTSASRATVEALARSLVGGP